ncbi:MAG TPA: 4-carboxymuconolactone decarboxylase [Acidimicrobiia bacterium]|nr:4-carboxymuconolactone decarboxylase [Acidimicrobiia bacterium]
MDSRFELGMETRRQVLGEDYVDQAMARTTDLDADFQKWITETAWAGVWARPGLERKVKSLITIALLAALGHTELEVHLRAAANTGATPAEVAEALMHVAVYAGVPAANHAFGVAKSVYEGT